MLAETPTSKVLLPVPTITGMWEGLTDLRIAASVPHIFGSRTSCRAMHKFGAMLNETMMHVLVKGWNMCNKQHVFLFLLNCVTSWDSQQIASYITIPWQSKEIFASKRSSKSSRQRSLPSPCTSCRTMKMIIKLWFKLMQIHDWCNIKGTTSNRASASMCWSSPQTAPMVCTWK